MVLLDILKDIDLLVYWQILGEVALDLKMENIDCGKCFKYTVDTKELIFISEHVNSVHSPAADWKLFPHPLLHFKMFHDFCIHKAFWNKSVKGNSIHSCPKHQTSCLISFSVHNYLHISYWKLINICLLCSN